MRRGFFKLALLGQGASQVVVGLGETGVKSYRLLVMGNSSHKIPPPAQQDGKIVMRPGKIRFNLQGLPILYDGLFRPALPTQRNPNVKMRLGIIALEAYRLVIISDRLF